MPPQNKVSAPAPTPPRAVLLMDAPTNSIIAGYLIEKGYSVEIIRDLKFCNTNLLKSSRFIFIGPNTDNSAYYNKIIATLKKMIPDRLFEESGQELISKLKKTVTKTVQPLSKSHPLDSKLQADKRSIEDQENLKGLKPEKPIPPVGASSHLETLINAVSERESDPSSIGYLSAQISKDAEPKNAIPVNERLAKEIKKYTDILECIGKIDCEKEILLKDEELPEDASTELGKLTSLLAKPLSPDRVLQKAKVNEEKAQISKDAGKPYPPRKLPEGDLYDRIFEITQLQDSLITEKAHMRYKMSDFFATNICRDKHYKIFKSIGVDANYLYGTWYFYMALLTFKKKTKDLFFNKKSEYSKMTVGQTDSSKKSGLGGFFKKKEEETVAVEIDPAQIKLQNEVLHLGCVITQLEKDLTTFEAELCSGFWNIYEQLCYLILIDKVKNKTFLRYIRSFLRFGLISEHKNIISEQQLNALFSASEECHSEFLHEPGVTNIVYPDEALLQMSKGNTPYSFDEELELNGQGTPAHKFDKVVRKVYASDFKVKIYTREIATWQKVVDKQKKSVSSAQKLLEEQEKGTKEYKVIQAGMREAKTELSRVSKIIEKLQPMIDHENETIETQKENFQKINYTIDLKEKASIEAKTIRKFCKLLSNLKENFFPFLLRDNFDPTTKNMFNRTVTSEAVAKFEEDDPRIFTTDLVEAQNPKKQVLIRYSPLYMTLPCMGTSGFCIAPSNNSDTGRFVLPLMAAQQIPLSRMIVDISSDFRYDTAKDNAGMDLMTSDTICAAYGKVRWDYRKKGKEFREKAGIYNDMQDKKNFKVHYRLYIESMDESGKKLFYKCNEMYEGFTKYIPLPKGKEKLSKN